MKRILLILILSHLFALAFAYNFGDVITNPDGSKGVVFWSNPNGSGGWMVALDDLPSTYQWGDSLDDLLTIENRSQYDTYNDTTGYDYTKLIREHYPAENYAANNVDFENGWYLPSLTQLAIIYVNIPFITPIILSENGSDFQNSNYWSSSEIDSIHSGALSFISGIGLIRNKVEYYNVREVCNYSNTSFEYDSTLTYLWNTSDTTAYIKVAPNITTDYYVIASNESDCESFAEQTIFVAASQTEIINDTICEGETYSENGFNETTTGTYTNVATGDNGCSLTLELHLVVNSISEQTIYDTVSVGHEYMEHGFNYPYIDVVGDIKDTLVYTSKAGCDSMLYLELYVKPVYNEVVNDTICQGETYERNGFSLPKQQLLGLQTYELFLTTSDGCCDSIVELKLRVYPASFSYTNATICEDESYEFNGQVYTEPGIYSAYLTNFRACDSIASLRLFRNNITSSVTKDTICQGETYDFNGNTYTETGTYQTFFNNQFGCDSIAYLELLVNQTSSSQTEVTICEGETYDFNGNIYAAAGIYNVHLTNAVDCDSLATLVLNVSSPDSTYLYETITSKDTYYFNDQYLNIDGIYRDTLSSFYNCDSVIILELIVVKGVEPPEVFTPNNDGINDEFVIKNLEQYPNNKVKIFNRWGNLVWEGAPYINNWDGTSNRGVKIGGDELPVGTYFYIIDLGNGNKVQKGYIYLNR